MSNTAAEDGAWTQGRTEGRSRVGPSWERRVSAEVLTESSPDAVVGDGSAVLAKNQATSLDQGTSVPSE